MKKLKMTKEITLTLFTDYSVFQGRATVMLFEFFYKMRNGGIAKHIRYFLNGDLSVFKVGAGFFKP